MAIETFAERLKRLLEAKGMTQYRLAKNSGIDEAYISQLVAGDVKNPRGDTQTKLAMGLRVPVGELMGEAKRPKERYDRVSLVNIPLRGYVSAGLPVPVEEIAEGFVKITRDDVGMTTVQLARLYALKVSGPSLEGDGINNGDILIVDPEATFVDGRIYVVNLGGAIAVRHVFRENGRARLVSSNGGFHEITTEELDIQGRVILSVKPPTKH